MIYFSDLKVLFGYWDCYKSWCGRGLWLRMVPWQCHSIVRTQGFCAYLEIALIQEAHSPLCCPPWCAKWLCFAIGPHFQCSWLTSVVLLHFSSVSSIVSFPCCQTTFGKVFVCVRERERRNSLGGLFEGKVTPYLSWTTWFSATHKTVPGFIARLEIEFGFSISSLVILSLPSFSMQIIAYFFLEHFSPLCLKLPFCWHL